MSSVNAVVAAVETVDAMADTSARVAEQMNGIGGALTMSIIAFTVVFLVLGGLSGIIYAIKYLAQALERKDKNEPPTGGKVVPVAAAPVAATGPKSDGRLMAVLAAAVAASGASGRILGVALAGGAARPARSAGWKSVALAEGIQPLLRDWK